MNPLFGILLKITSVLMFVVMNALIKALSAHFPTGELIFFRSFFAIPVIVGWIAWRGDLRHGLRTQDPRKHVFRGLVGTTAMGLGFLAVGLLPLPEATAIGYAAPLLTVIFAAMFLGEDVRAFRLSMVALGMSGVMIVLAPRLGAGGQLSDAQALGALAALSGAGCVALVQIFISRMVRTERTSAIVFWFSVTATVVSLATIPWGWAMPTPAQAALLVLTGLIGGAAQIFMTSSYRFAETSVVAPFDYVSMIFALVIGYWIFAEVPTWPMLGGASLIIVAGILIIWRERQLGIRRARKSRSPGG